MKALIQKELRENLKLAVLGLVVITVILLQVYRHYGELLRPLAAGGTDAPGSYLQPLANGELLGYVGIFCAAFAVVLGWFQSFNERHRDLWSFLAHRPLTRTQLFLGKIIAGLGLYLLVAGLPLVCFIVWAITPGHVAAPFEGSMLLPHLVVFLAGPVYYFAGMLTGLRQARWYASRSLGLGGAVLLSVATVGLTEFGQVLFVVLAVGAILAVATWGAFHSNGFYAGQPQAGRMALTAALALGCVVVSVVAIGFLETFLPRWSADYGSWSRYVMTKDGTLYKATYAPNRAVQVADLQGRPLLDPKTGRPIDREDFDQMAVRDFALGVDFGDRPNRRHHYLATGHFIFLRATPHTLWYYWPRYGRFVAYDPGTRQPVGSLGPNGFARDFSGGGARFDYSPGTWPQTRVVKSTNSIYRLDLEAQTATAVFTAPPGETFGALSEITPHDYRWEYSLAATRRMVYLLKPDGQVVWQAPYQPAYPDYAQLAVSVLPATNQFALWVRPDSQAEQEMPASHPAHVAWFAGGQIVKTNELPSLARPGFVFGTRDRVTAALGAPVMFVSFAFIAAERPLTEIPWALLWSSLAAAAFVCVPLGWWLARRYSFSVGAQLGWSLFLLATGVPGLLTFLAVRDWPARETCPKCGKLRTVEHEACEHCTAPWPPPQPAGIEIFEPAK